MPFLIEFKLDLGAFRQQPLEVFRGLRPKALNRLVGVLRFRSVYIEQSNRVVAVVDGYHQRVTVNDPDHGAGICICGGRDDHRACYQGSCGH